MNDHITRLTPMNLGDLIGFLESLGDTEVWSLVDEHSYRGYYDQLAFEVGPKAPARQVAQWVKECVGQTFQGYKGGDFTMDESTDVWIASYGTTNDSGRIIGYEGDAWLIAADRY